MVKSVTLHAYDLNALPSLPREPLPPSLIEDQSAPNTPMLDSEVPSLIPISGVTLLTTLWLQKEVSMSRQQLKALEQLSLTQLSTAYYLTSLSPKERLQVEIKKLNRLVQTAEDFLNHPQYRMFLTSELDILIDELVKRPPQLVEHGELMELNHIRHKMGALPHGHLKLSDVAFLFQHNLTQHPPVQRGLRAQAQHALFHQHVETQKFYGQKLSLLKAIRNTMGLASALLIGSSLIPEAPRLNADLNER